jgi:hypothetical protein
MQEVNRPTENIPPPAGPAVPPRADVTECDAQIVPKWGDIPIF